MRPIFRRRSNTIFRFAMAFITGGVPLLAIFLVAVPKWTFWQTEVHEMIPQPVPFSHQHHVAGLGIDCRYCHTTVENTATAGMPSSHTCMTCHSQIWQNAKMLEPVRESYSQQKPLEWNRVTRLPKYVYFNHSIHVQKGIGCTSCHGPIHMMPLTWKERTFYMRDCLSCHTEPEKSIRPKEQVFNVYWQSPSNQNELGAQLVKQYHIPKQRLTDCNTCHR